MGINKNRRDVVAPKCSGDLQATAGSVGTTELADGVFSADAAGRLKMATDLFDEATVDAKFAAGAIDASDRLKLASVITDRLAAAILSADATGRALFAAGVFDEATVDLIFAAGAIDASDRLKANSVISDRVETGLLQYVDKQLTNAEVLAFRATPIPLVAAPGADLAIVVHSVHIVSNDVAGAWTESTDNLVVEYAGGVDITAALVGADLVGGGVQVKKQGVLDTALIPEANAAVEIFNTGDGEWGGGNAANTMSFRIWYSVVPTVAFS